MNDPYEQYLDENGYYKPAAFDAFMAKVEATTAEEFHERAAIIEYDGNLPRQRAEILAWRSVYQYDLLNGFLLEAVERGGEVPD